MQGYIVKALGPVTQGTRAPSSVAFTHSLTQLTQSLDYSVTSQLCSHTFGSPHLDTNSHRILLQIFYV